MKSIFNYYIAILVPVLLLIWLSKTDAVDPMFFVIALFFYAFVYRTYIDGKRLVAKNIIVNNDIWKMIIPGSRIKYFKELYLK